jgi:poly(A) polymerase
VSESRAFSIQVVQRLREAGFVALWAGGCVRDLLMGNDPADYDVATSATPQQVRHLFGFRRTLPVGISFGVVIVIGPSKAAGQVEVATFRTDASYSDGRRPDAVTYSTPEEDASRRDFTINGMFYDPLEEHVIDYVGGQQDLQRQLIRAIGDPHARLAEDKLRMLRAVRFAARFGFAIDPETRQAIHSHAREVAVVSAERIADEVRRTLQTKQSSWAIQTWYETGVLHVIAPAVNQAWPQIASRAMRLVEAMDKEDWLAKAAAIHWPLVEDSRFSPAEVARLIDAWKLRLKLANEEAEALAFALQSQPVLEQSENLPWSHVQPWLIKPHIATALSLLSARSSSCAGPLSQADADRQKVVEWLRTRLAWGADQLNPPPLLGGHDLQQLGLKPGPEYRTILQAARDKQLDGELVDRSAALNWLMSIRDSRGSAL